MWGESICSQLGPIECGERAYARSLDQLNVGREHMLAAWTNRMWGESICDVVRSEKVRQALMCVGWVNAGFVCLRCLRATACIPHLSVITPLFTNLLLLSSSI
eukprot:2378330-Pyramimonas_sp.AAC.1